MTDFQLDPTPARKGNCRALDRGTDDHRWEHKGDSAWVTDDHGRYYIQTAACRDCGTVRTRRVEEL